MRKTSLALGLVVGLAGLTAASSTASADRGRRDHTMKRYNGDGFHAPPQRRAFTRRVRAGHIWVNGRYVMRYNRWVWSPGHWIHARRGYTYQQGRWIHRHGRYVWTPGSWNRAPVRRVYRNNYYRRTRHDNRRFQRDRSSRRGYDSRIRNRRNRWR